MFHQAANQECAVDSLATIEYERHASFKTKFKLLPELEQFLYNFPSILPKTESDVMGLPSSLRRKKMSMRIVVMAEFLFVENECAKTAI